MYNQKLCLLKCDWQPVVRYRMKPYKSLSLNQLSKFIIEVHLWTIQWKGTKNLHWLYTGTMLHEGILLSGRRGVEKWLVANIDQKVALDTLSFWYSKLHSLYMQLLFWIPKNTFVFVFSAFYCYNHPKCSAYPLGMSGDATFYHKIKMPSNSAVTGLILCENHC